MEMVKNEFISMLRPGRKNACVGGSNTLVLTAVVLPCRLRTDPMLAPLSKF